MELLAPAKLNLCLYVGPAREDGRHELVSLFMPLSLADRIEVTPAAGDRVVCEAVPEDNLAERALAALRRAGWQSAPIEVRIEKRIPVQAGLGGGSADAAAVLRLARGEVDGLEEIALGLGADVPSQLVPRFALVRGVGEREEPLPEPEPAWAVLLPRAQGLSTGAVFARADEMGIGRDERELEEVAGRLREASRAGGALAERAELLVNDLLPAAASMHPDVAPGLETLRGAGAELAGMTGSGPTVFGLFAREDEAAAAARSLGEEAILCRTGGPA